MALCAALVGLSSEATAGPSDLSVNAIIDKSMKPDLSPGWAQQKALQNVAFAEQLCEKGCEAATKARLEAARATALAYAGKDADAQEAFQKAIKLDPNVKPFAGKEGPPVDKAFAAAQAASGIKPAKPPADAPKPKPKKDPEAGAVAEGDNAKEKPKKEEASAKPKPKKKPKEKPAASATTAAGDASPLNLTIGTEVSAYQSDTAVSVLSPAVYASIENPTEGWGVNGSFLVDVVTAASPDIVATASPRWLDLRVAPALGAHVKADETDVFFNGSMSQESDYTAFGAGIGVSTPFREKMIVPSLGYQFGLDISGRAGTPYSTFSRLIHRHSINTAATFIVNKSTIIVPGFDVVMEFGDTSKPYRYVPMFSQDQAGTIEPGESIDSVNAKRLSVRPLEQLPDTRQRYAFSGLLAHRLAPVTFRAEQRLYFDSWGLVGATTDGTIPWDVVDGWRLWPHARFHAQTATDFWKLTYVVPDNTTQGVQNQALPALRTGDPELGPLITLTGGLGTRFDIGAEDDVGLVLQGDVMYTSFLDHLYLSSRLAGFASVTFELLFQ